MTDSALARTSQLRKELATSKTFGELATVAKKAISIQQAMSRAGLALELVNDAAEVWIEALFMCGGKMHAKGRGRPKKNSMDHTNNLGQHARMHAQQLCRRLPDGRKSIRAYVTDATESGAQATAAGCLSHYRRPSSVKTPPPPPGTYATILADPPWDWGDEGDVSQMGRGTPDYAAMSIEELEDLSVEEWAAPNAHLYLWITNRSLPKGFGLIESWGFRYVTCVTWCKPSFGMGNYFRGSTEQILFGVRGSLPLNRKNAGTWFEAPRGKGGHSSKPAAAYELIESCSPGPYLEMFARSDRKGWKRWGAKS